jgi:uncharacterized protein (TIGR01244 family)
MTNFRKVTESFSVSPQILTNDVAAAVAQGIVLIINNRPDGEAPDQPPGGEIEAASRAAGIAYLHLPVVGRPTEAQAAVMRAALEAAGGPALAFCRSGTRSISAWAMGAAGSREQRLRTAAAAGYDLSAVLP